MKRIVLATGSACALALSVAITASASPVVQQRSDNDQRQSTRLDILCVARSNGAVRIVDSRNDCRNNEFVIDLDELQGPAGPTGPRGPAGAAGPQGPQGARGATGAVGARGATGAPGAQGPAGPQGVAGATGAPGADGAVGAQGPAGAAGAQGATGVAGPAGATGAPGADGARGVDGAVGAQGPTGATGAQGATGAPGADGARGADGAVGAQGPVGPQGATGAPGADGARGADGAVGAQGPTGATGAQGATGAPGADGARGADGAVGAQGPTGATGAQGATGAPGADGARGADGAVGAQGPIGPTGPAGPGGAAAVVRAATSAECASGGVVVSDGTTSVPVCNGAAGARGATGSQGATGPAGPAGGGTAVDEDTAMAPIKNLLVTVENLPAFRPTAVSRIGFDVDNGGMHMPRFAPIKFMLPADAPIAQLRSFWQQALTGDHIGLDFVLDLQLMIGTSTKPQNYDLWRLRLRNATLIGFADGTIGPASMLVQPGSFYPDVEFTQAPTDRQTIEDPTYYDFIDLPMLTTPTFSFTNNTRSLGLHRISGGETTLDGSSSGGANTTDLVLTLIAEMPQLKIGTVVDIRGFELVYDWIETALGQSGGALQRGITLTPRNAVGQPGTPTALPNTTPLRFNLINPLLIDATSGMAPYAFDLRLRIEPF